MPRAPWLPDKMPPLVQRISNSAKTVLSACSEMFVQLLYVLANVLLDARRAQKTMVTRIAAGGTCGRVNGGMSDGAERGRTVCGDGGEEQHVQELQQHRPALQREAGAPRAREREGLHARGPEVG